MKILKIIFWILWRSWFYALVFVVTLLLSPILFILLLREKWYGAFYFVSRNFWAKPILYGMGFVPTFLEKQKIDSQKSYIFVANHTSMMDIMLMFYLSKNPLVFVGKKELENLFLFGYFYKRVAILVDRSNSESRKSVYASAQERLNKGVSICIFPEGGVPDESVVLSPFKDGAFRLAIDYQIPLIPIIFWDCKRRFPFRFFAGSMGKLRISIYPFIQTNGFTQDDRIQLKQSLYQFMLDKLTKQPEKV